MTKIPGSAHVASCPETPLQLIKCGCSMSVCETSRRAKNIVLICVAVEQKRTRKLLPVINMLMTFEQLL